MYCPEHLVFQAGRGKYLRVTLWLYWRDVPRDTIPISVWLNPFRYQISLVSRFKKLATVNPRGQWWNRMLAAASKENS